MVTEAYNKDDMVAANINEMGQVVPCEKDAELAQYKSERVKEPWTDRMGRSHGQIRRKKPWNNGEKENRRFTVYF
ncbi:hypothetical protein QL285_035487 [Trifolium repens]|jgi:hypothetical protein|nr:hypothetical protein QL285_035487 [Trifolium repens]